MEKIGAKMIKLKDIKVGDYVEMKDGWVGYVYRIVDNYIYFTNSNKDESFAFEDTPSSNHILREVFKRIGNYDFIEKKCEIKPLEYGHTEKKMVDKVTTSCNGTCEWKHNGLCDVFVKTSDMEIIDKINEIIDYINKKDSQC